MDSISYIPSEYKEYISVDYGRPDESKTFVIDCQKFAPLYAENTIISCSYCDSSYGDEAMKKALGDMHVMNTRHAQK